MGSERVPQRVRTDVRRSPDRLEVSLHHPADGAVGHAGTETVEEERVGGCPPGCRANVFRTPVSRVVVYAADRLGVQWHDALLVPLAHEGHLTLMAVDVR